MNQASPTPKRPVRLSEDWLSVLIGFALILLAILGILGPSGLVIVF